MTAPKNRDRILDVREERSGATPLEFREDKSTGQVILRGYAATYEPYDCYGGPEMGGWVEQLQRSSFDKTLQAQPDVMLLLNHTGAPLARTKSGTMTLTTDRRGLLVEARLDPTDPDVQSLLPKMRRGDLDEMSFAFKVKEQAWNDDYTQRTINEVSLQKGDVSVVNYGMNPNTRVKLSEGAVGALAQLSHDQLVELRKLDSTTVERAIANLNRVRAEARAACDEEDEDMERSKNPFAEDDEDDKEAERSGNPFAEDDEDEDDEEKAKRSENPFAEDDEEEEEEEEEEEQKGLDLSIAAALDKTISHALALAEGNEAVQGVLTQAQSQLNKMRGVDNTGQTEVERKLRELRKECGLPDTGSVEDGLAFLRSEGSAPMGLGHRAILESAKEAQAVAEQRVKELADAALAAERALYESLGYVPKP
jgi:HK97 family phage prohead protease